MTSKKFFITSAFIYLVLFFATVTINYYLDDFGLFRSHSERRIWAREKTSKYLMSYKYIPDNFDAVLVGSSVSANLDTRKITSYKMYNLSMNSGNITELKYPLEVLAESGKIKAVVFCLYDYTTKNSGVKGNQIDKKEYWGSLFSDIPFDVLKYKIKFNYLNIMPDIFKSSENGFQNFNLTKTNIVFAEINKTYMSNPRKQISIDSTAFEEFGQIVDLLHRKNIKIYGYYYPIYKEWFKIFENNGEWEKYKRKMSDVFDPERDIIFDLNDSLYNYISCSKESYTDGHLSDKGTEEVLKVIEKYISE
ncbi:MAG: hypothetical protein RBS89_00330 [Candidatus Delongbacteria bacterium]|jgi:hypothetical protein|nr:hypothetical protein [Candidatus Delongbacteria bacterium]